MRVNSNMLMGLVLCMVLFGGVAFLTRINKGQHVWTPNDIYSSIGGSSYSIANVSTSTASNSGVTLSLRSSRPLLSSARRTTSSVISYAPAQSAPAYSQSPIGGMPSNSVASPIYTTSSAEFRSFGGGGNGGGVSISGGVATSSGAASATGLSTTMPSTSMYAYSNDRNPSSVATNDWMSSVSGGIAMASTSSYAGIGQTTGGASRAVAGRHNVPGVGSSDWIGWLDTEWKEGYDGITLNMLRDLYVRMTGDTDFSNEGLWNSFLAWFESNQSNEKFGWYWAPISDAVPFVLLLCLMYAFVIYRKTKQAKKTNAEN